MLTMTARVLKSVVPTSAARPFVLRQNNSTNYTIDLSIRRVCVIERCFCHFMSICFVLERRKCFGKGFYLSSGKKQIRL